MAHRLEFAYRTGATPTIVRQVNIASSEVMRGYTWINKTQWPIRDPRFRGFDYVACMACGGQLDRLRRPCDCTFADLPRKWKNPDEDSDEEDDEQDTERFDTSPKLLDLGRYQGRGTGVRALQNFKKGDIIDEYTGELYPKWITNSDREAERAYAYPDDLDLNYRLEQRLAPRIDSSKPKRKSKTPSPQTGRESSAMIIDSAVRGNWTRYVNHCCAFSTKFECINVGNKKYTIVVATREIEFGEEITTDYGWVFWKYARYNCACGAKGCKYRAAKARKCKGSSNNAHKSSTGAKSTPSKPSKKRGANGKMAPAENGKQTSERKRASDDDDDVDDDEPQRPVKRFKLTAPKRPTNDDADDDIDNQEEH